MIIAFAIKKIAVFAMQLVKVAEKFGHNVAVWS
jgi:hypothetical protein